MKKHVIAAAVAAAIGVPAAAQVTVSGTMDVAATRSSKITTMSSGSTTAVTTDVKGTGSGSNSAGTVTSTVGWATSELIFQATEDLGGGLKATARYSQNIGTESLASRDRYIDVAGNFGSVRLGRFNPFTGNYNSFSGAGSTNQAGDLNNVTTGGSRIFGSAITNGSFERQAGMIQYTSPSMSGFTAAVGYADNSSDVTTTANSLTENKMQFIGLEYSAGPLKIAAAMGEGKNKTAAVARTAGKAFFTNGTHNATGTQSGDAATTVGAGAVTGDYTLSTTLGVPTSVTGAGVSGVVTSAGVASVAAADAKNEFDWLGASYNLGPATVLVSHARYKRTTQSLGSASVTAHDLKLNSVGLMVPVGATTLRASAYDGKDERAVGATDDMKVEGYQISATYDLSKRTYFYASMGESDVKRDGTSSTAATRTEKTNAIGLVHKF